MDLNKVLGVAVLFLGLVNFFLWQEIFSWDGNLHIIFFDVGQGDAIFFESPEGHQILIDGGPNKKLILKKLAKEVPFWDRSLDLIILTHPDRDHLAGLNSVLEHYRVENILWTGVQRKTRIFENWQRFLKKERANTFFAQKNQIIRAGGLTLKVLYPEKNLQGQVFERASNDSSVVLRGVYGKTSFFLPGDITKEVEKNLLKKELLARTELLKVAHHGSRLSTSNDFLEKIKPKVAVISVGKNNPYGHPHSIVLQNLRKFGINILRTDVEGDIETISDGTTLSFDF